jgi:transcriptional regulator with XRE-family HTH domain
LRIRANRLSLKLKSPHDVRLQIAERFRSRRLSQTLTQRELAIRSGMSLGSLKRFEASGLIALDSLLRLALALGFLQDFERIGAESSQLERRTLDELLQTPRKRQRGKTK